MAIHWQVKFRSLRAETLYTVNIYDDSYSGDPVQLTGAAQPFVTEEDDDDDMFTPVRTQSGYLRIVDTGKDNAGNAFDWMQMAPSTDTDRPVTLTKDGVIMWEGFMQAQHFGSRLYESPQEREFPLQCSLTVTSRMDINFQQTKMQNFAYLLLQVVDSIPSVCRPNRFVFQNSLAQSMLMKLIDWQNFSTTGDDFTLTSSDTIFGCLEAMCKFWGWTARTWQSSIYFVSADDSGDRSLISIGYDRLQAIAEGYSQTFQPFNFETLTLSGDVFASVNNDVLLLRGPNTVEITANANAGDPDVVDVFPSNAVAEMFSGGYYTEQYGDIRGYFTDNINEFTSPYLNGQCLATTESFNMMRVGEGRVINNDLLNAIRIKQSFNGSSALVSLESVFEHSFYSEHYNFAFGGLYVSGEIYRKGERYVNADSVTGAGLSHVIFRFGIGSDRANALWWNGSSWVQSVTYFQVAVGGSDDSDVLFAARTENPDIRGRIFIDILGSDDMIHETSTYVDRFDLINLKVTFRKSVNVSSVFGDFSRKESYTYSAKNTNTVHNEWNIDTIFATDNYLSFGYGVLTNPDGTPFKGIGYGGSSTLTPPEQRLAERVAAYWSQARRKMQLELLANKTASTGIRDVTIGDISPEMMETVEGKLMYSIGISKDWRQDVVALTLMEA